MITEEQYLNRPIILSRMQEILGSDIQKFHKNIQEDALDYCLNWSDRDVLIFLLGAKHPRAAYWLECYIIDHKFPVLEFLMKTEDYEEWCATLLNSTPSGNHRFWNYMGEGAYFCD